MYDEATIGARLRTLRRWRGMSLATLAGLSGLSKSFLSMAERGQRALDRRSHIAALSQALQVSETDLIGGPHLTRDPAQSGPHTYIPALRVAVETNGLHQDPVIDHARPLRDLAVLMAGPVERERRRYNYLEVGRHLPGLIDELHVHAAAPADEAAQRLALETLVEAYMCAAGMARSLGHPDLGHIAAMRADETAVALDDPVARGKAGFALLRPNGDNWDRIKVMAERAVDRLEPHARDESSMQVLGMLMLNASMASAARLDSAAARHWLDEAAALAARVPDDLDANWQAFSTTNVRIWRISVSVECGESGAAVTQMAAAVDRAKLSAHPARMSCFYADVGRGLARDPRHRADAVRWLKDAEGMAPQRIRNDAKVRESVAVMLEQARVAAGGRELRGMAARMGIPH
jgi:transcriptional regulator with XRE-family HTH domain